MSVRRSHLEISGMSCATCSGTIEEAVGSLPGVHEVDANFATDEGSVEYDSDTTSLAEIYDAIEDAGYEPARASATVEIAGMSCSTCAETNERAIESVPGVIEASVNYASDEARVAYNPADADFEAVYDAIESADVLKAIRISEATISKVHQNLFWAFVYNATLIPVASLGLLDPALAGLAMAGSSVSVMTNSLAFRGYDPHEEYRLLGFLR